METPQKRSAWVDHLKAFLIYTIVVEHMNHMMFDDLPNFYVDFISSFNVAAFFFLSGMFVTSQNQVSKFIRSLTALLIPFVVIGLLWTHFYQHAPLLTLFTNHMHHGYWFIWTLMALRILFFLRNILVNRLLHLRSCVLAADTLIVLGTVSVSFLTDKFLPQEVCSLFALETLRAPVICYFMGHWYKEAFLNQGREIPKGVIEGAFLILLASFALQAYTDSATLHLALRPVRAVCGTLVIVSMFKALPEVFRGCGFVQFIGKRTLEIYMCHYFIFPIGIASLCLPIVHSGEGVTFLFYCLIAATMMGVLSFTLWVVNQFSVLNFLLFGKKSSSKRLC